MPRYAMVADLERCVGCQTCTAACRHANATAPGVQWRRVLDIEAGAYPDVSRTFVPVGCQHCADPPCMHVCPTTATRQRPDGIVTVDYDLCIGCAYCEVACPYQARFKVEDGDGPRSGVSQKCTFCSDRIDDGLANGLVPGVDPRATPACVNSCIADALHFGDVDDPQSNVSRLLRENKVFRMHEELGTKPGFYYLQDRRPAHKGETVRGEGIEPKHQQHWDWKAAMNFLCGGAGAALFALAVLSAVPNAAIHGIWLMGLGLSILFLKIGRPLRFLYVLRQPRRSWMSREAWIAALFFPLALYGTLWNSKTAQIVAALAALAFLFAQAMILKESKGVPAWRSPRVVPVIVTTGLAEGAGLLSLFAPMPLLLAGLVLARAWTWHQYVRSVEAPVASLEVLYGSRGWMLWAGLVAPLACALIGLNVMAGLLTVVTGWAVKFILVTRAGYQQGFALKRAGTIIKPGWRTQ